MKRLKEWLKQTLCSHVYKPDSYLFHHRLALEKGRVLLLSQYVKCGHLHLLTIVTPDIIREKLLNIGSEASEP